jgi:hypothetical protein
MGPVNTDGSFHTHVIYDGRSDRPANAKKAPDEEPESAKQPSVLDLPDEILKSAR